MQLEQYNGMRIAVTGASGFIGSALVARLQDVACSLDVVSRCSGRTVQSSGVARIRSSARDLTSIETWRELLAGNDIIFHLSAQTDLYHAEQDPAESEAANVVPVECMATAARTIGGAPPKVIFASTATIVGLNETNPVDDAYPDNPITVYDRHKKWCEEILADAAAAGRLQACSLRLANVFGFGAPSTNNNRGFLNAMICRAANGEDLTLYGDGRFVRDFIHIDDVVDAFYSAATARAAADGQHFIVASGVGHTLREALKMVSDTAQNVLGRVARVVEVPEPATLHPIERRSFVGDSSRFAAVTGWCCQRDLRSGIRSFMQRLAGSIQSCRAS